jgi:hypothetical protein
MFVVIGKKACLRPFQRKRALREAAIIEDYAERESLQNNERARRVCQAFCEIKKCFHS